MNLILIFSKCSFINIKNYWSSLSYQIIVLIQKHTNYCRICVSNLSTMRKGHRIWRKVTEKTRAWRQGIQKMSLEQLVVSESKEALTGRKGGRVEGRKEEKKKKCRMMEFIKETGANRKSSQWAKLEQFEQQINGSSIG